MKDTFILYTRYSKQVKMLDDAQAGTLLKAILAHESGEELPEMDGMTMMLYSVIEERLEYDAEQYSQTVKKRSEAGKKGGRPKAVEEEVEPEEAEQEEVEAEAEEIDETNVLEGKAKKANGFSEKAKKANGFFEKANESKKSLTDTETETETETEKTKKREGNRLTRFTPPSPDEVALYCRERGNQVDPEAFMDFYASKGWKVGNQPMKDWKAAVRTWEKRDNRSGSYDKPKGGGTTKTAEYNSFSQRSYDYNAILKAKLNGGRA